MSAVYVAELTSINDAQESAGKRLSLREIKRYKTWGAHSVDYFEVNRTDLSGSKDRFLVTTNYYKCNDHKNNPENCFPVSILKYSPSDSTKFKSSVELQARGPAQSDHFYYFEDTFLVVADNFASSVVIYKFMKEEWIVYQRIDCPGVAAIAVISIDNEVLLVAASYHNNGWSTKSPVYKLSYKPETPLLDPNRMFKKIQDIETQGAHDVELLSYKGDVYLFISEDRNDLTAHIDSKILRYSAADRNFVLIQV